MPPKPPAHDKDPKAALKTAEAALEAAIRRERDNAAAVQRRVAEVVHDIKNPLSAMLANAEILRKESLGPLGDARYRAIAESIHESGLRLLEYCQGLLGDFLRESRQRQNMEAPAEGREAPRTVDAAAMVREIVALNQALAGERGIRLDAKISPDFPPIHTLPTHLHRALTNLVSNALKFTPRGGKVVIDARVDADKNALVLVVRDTGPGLTATDILRLLRYDSPTRSEHGEAGAGLGLANVVHLVRKAGGDIEIEAGRTQGAAVTLKFPHELTRAAA
jgi:two-component system cell cycle sensor histidine kinase PleC